MISHLLEALALLLPLAAMSVLVRTFIRKQPALAAARKNNIAIDRQKLALPKYPPVVRQNQLFALYMFLPLIVVVTPFVTSFEALPWWRYLTDILLVLGIYDFLYYLTHRFLFHGNAFKGYFKRVHGLHHQARNPSHIDAQYVHPMETFIGLALLYVSVIGTGLVWGDFHVLSMAVCFFFYSQLNILNHADIDIPDFPYSIATWISRKHHRHHIDMSHGNYASMILLYDQAFGTLE